MSMKFVAHEKTHQVLWFQPYAFVANGTPKEDKRL
jgi:hypothetical protein